METLDGTIQTLHIEQGEKYNQKTGDGAVAFVGAGRRSSIVFAPRGAVPGQQARVKLIVMKNDDGTPRCDRAGRPMYRSVPAPVEYVDRWRDNGDGSASRVTYSINWLYKESEEGVCETRTLTSRERESHTTNKWRVVWGASVEDSFLELTPTKVVALEAETIQNGSIVWIKTGERPEPQPGKMELIARVSPVGGLWHAQRLTPSYTADLTVELEVKYEGERRDLPRTVMETWGNLPGWYQNECVVPYPLCPCGRRRCEKQADGYTKCERCRAEDKCGRCGTEPVKVAVISGQLVCPSCQPKARLELVANEQLPRSRRATLAAEARQLMAGRALPKLVAKEWLAATTDHLPEDWQRSKALAIMSNYGWYYLLEEGVFASKFSPEALEILQHIEHATGNGLVELAGWLTTSQYYEERQVKGEDPPLDFSAASFQANLTLARKIRGSETERQDAVAALQQLTDTLGADAFEVRAMIRALSDEAQDYAAALKIARDAQSEVAAKTSGDILLGFSVYHRRGGNSGCADAWVITPDGTLRDPDVRDVPRHKFDGTYTWHRVAAQELALRWDLGTAHDVVGSSTCTVAKLPKGGATAEQLKKVAEIEKELGVIPGAFGLDEALAREQAVKLRAVRKAHDRLPSDLRNSEGWRDDWTFAQLSGKYGVALDSKGSFWSRVNHAELFGDSTFGRLAQVIYAVACAEGKLELLAYEKYGDHQLAMRWRTLRDGEEAGVEKPPATAPVAPSKPLDLSALAGAFGGAAKIRPGKKR